MHISQTALRNLLSIVSMRKAFLLPNAHESAWAPFSVPKCNAARYPRLPKVKSGVAMKSQRSLIETLPSYHSTELADRDALNSRTGLKSVEWLESYCADPANEAVLTAGAMLSNNAKLPPDHIVSVRMYPSLKDFQEPHETKLPAVLCLPQSGLVARHALHLQC